MENWRKRRVSSPNHNPFAWSLQFENPSLRAYPYMEVSRLVMHMWDLVSDCPSAAPSPLFLMPPSLNSGVYYLCSQTQASSQDGSIICNPAYLSHPHWTIPMPRENTLVVREKLQKDASEECLMIRGRDRVTASSNIKLR